MFFYLSTKTRTLIIFSKDFFNKALVFTRFVWYNAFKVQNEKF